MKSVVELKHPLAEDALATLRHRETKAPEFREALRRLALLLISDATRDLPLEAGTVETPLATSPAARLRARVAIVPILRAGLGMVAPVLELLPRAEVWHLGFYRDEATLEPVDYYSKLPSSDPPAVALVLDPMLATGGSAVAALGKLERWGVPDLRVLAAIAAPEGIRAVHERFPAARIHVSAIDSKLDARGFIVPGLGDAGDRLFNAEAR